MAQGDNNAVLSLRMDIQIPPRTEAELRRTLNKIEPGVRRQLSTKLRSGLTEQANAVLDGIPASAPLSGMTGNWGRAQAKIATYPKAPPGRAIATIKVFGDSSRFAKYLSMTELAGTVSRGKTKRGGIMIERLNKDYRLAGRGGRFIWKAWLKARPGAVRISIDAINEFVAKFNGRA